MRRRILIATVVAAAVSLSASIVAAKELVIGLGSVLTGVDPHWHNNGQNNSNAMHVFETLVKTDVKGKLVPGLATSWKALSPTQYELKIRQGVKFHDGSPFSAKDVVFSFDRVIKGVPNSPGSFAGFMKGVTKIEAVDDMTVRFTTNKPIPLIFKNISRIYIISEKNGKGAQTEDYTTGKATIGTGPYKFSRWVPGASVEYVRND